MNYNKLKRQLRIDEGIVLRVRIEEGGCKKFGIGHKIEKGDPSWITSLAVGDKIDKEKIDKVFEDDFIRAIANSQLLFSDMWELLDSTLKETIVNIMFSTGPRQFIDEFPDFIVRVYAGDPPGAAKAILATNWAKQVETRAYRLAAALESIENIT